MTTNSTSPRGSLPREEEPPPLPQSRSSGDGLPERPPTLQADFAAFDSGAASFDSSFDSGGSNDSGGACWNTAESLDNVPVTGDEVELSSRFHVGAPGVVPAAVPGPPGSSDGATAQSEQQVDLRFRGTGERPVALKYCIPEGAGGAPVGGTSTDHPIQHPIFLRNNPPPQRPLDNSWAAAGGVTVRSTSADHCEGGGGEESFGTDGSGLSDSFDDDFFRNPPLDKHWAPDGGVVVDRNPFVQTDDDFFKVANESWERFDG